MDKTQLYLNAFSFIVIAASATISILAYSIFRAIKLYNNKALEIRAEYEHYKEKQAKILLETEIEIQEQTFQLISKEIHDNITQCLSLANLTLNCLKFDDTEIEKEITKSKTQITKALNDLSSLSKSLDLDIIESHGLAAAAKFEVDRWNRLFDKTISIEICGEVKHLEKNRDLFLFRILQESINNAIKHSNAENINVLIQYRENELSLSVSDNGIGFDVNELKYKKEIGKKSGLKNIKQRSEHLGGVFRIQSQLGHGTQIESIIPFSNENEINYWISGRPQATS